MTKIKFEKWRPIDLLSESMHLEELHDSNKGFWFLLKEESGNKKTLKITFDLVLLYRKIDEGDFLMTIDKSVTGWTFFTAKNSDLLSWFNYQSQDIHHNENIIHYAIYTPDDCLDILSAYPPKVEWLS